MPVSRTTLPVVTACLLALLISSECTAAEWLYPLGVAQDAQGRILISDRKFHGVFVLQDNALTPLYEGLAKFRTPLNAVYCIHAGKDGAVYVGDSATREVYRLSAEGKLTALTNGQGENVPRDEYHPGKIGIPTQIATDSQGNVFTTDLELQRIWKIPAAGGEPAEFAVVAGGRGVATDAEDHVWILSSSTPQLRRVSPDGKTTEVIIETAVFNFPHQVVVLPDGNALVTDGYEKAVWKVDRAAKKAEKLVSGEPFGNPVGICLIENGTKALVMDPRAVPAASAAEKPSENAAAPAPPGSPALFEVTLDGKITRRFPPES